MRIASLLLFLLASASLRAEEPATPDHETLGLALFRKQQFADAIPHLEQAAALRHEAQLKLTLGECYRKIHDYPNAFNSYQRVLALEPPPDLESIASAGLEATTSEELRWRRDHPDPPKDPGPGGHRHPAPPAPDGAIDRAPVPASALRTSGWASLGLGVAAAGAGAFFGLQAKSAATDWAAATDSAAWRSARDSADSKAKLATISFVAAGALVVGGAAMVLLSPR